MTFYVKIRSCKAFQFIVDLTFFLLSSTALSVLIIINNEGIKDPRLTLGGSCLASETSAGIVKGIFFLGITIVVLMLLISLVGLFGCLVELTGVLFCYSMVAYVLTLLELLFFLSVTLHLDGAAETTKACFKDILVRYYNGPYNSSLFDSAGAWDFMHMKYHCCGVDSGDVFNSMVNWNRHWIVKYNDPFSSSSLKLEEFKVITILPYTCCKFKDERTDYRPDDTVETLRNALVDEDCPSDPTTTNSYIKVGCFSLLHKFVGDATVFVLNSCILPVVLQLSAAMCALYASRAILNQRKRDVMKSRRMIE